MLSRLPTTARIAALSILLVLISNIALVGFIRYATEDSALTELRQRVVSDADSLARLDREAGRAVLIHTIRDRMQVDDATIVALADVRGNTIVGNVPRHELPVPLVRTDFHTATVSRLAGGTPLEAGYTVTALGNGDWLVSGRVFDERLTLQRTIQRSLELALALSVAMGVVSGIFIARYVGNRVERIARVADAVGSGDLARRAEVGGSGDAFDQLAARINAMLDRIGALMSELRLLTDSLAHDLRSPIGRLRARVERALTTVDESQRDMLLSGVLDEADTLARMLTTVLEIGRSEAMTPRAQFAAVDASALVAELGEMYEPLAEEQGVAMTVDADGGVTLFQGHRQLLAQALSNLIDNALKYGGSSLRIYTAVEHSALALGVADRGPGIAPADMAEARRRFGRLDTSRAIPGAGLGLSLVEAVAHLHGGTLRIRNAGPGLDVAILLPI